MGIMYIAEERSLEVPLTAAPHKILQTFIVFGIRQEVLPKTPPPKTLLAVIQLDT